MDTPEVMELMEYCRELEGKVLEKKYTHILGEYNNYEAIHKEDVACIKTNNPGFRIEKKLKNDNNCWRSIFLKKAGVIDEELIPYFPITLSLLQSDQIHNAFFSILDPHVDIPPHKGYFKGYLRYHLGIKIPHINSQRPYLVCGGVVYEWKNGEGIVFDDMYSHYVNNPSGQTRVILYLDLKRSTLCSFDSKLVDIMYRYLESHPLVQTINKNQHTTQPLS
jgi:hypothetical protein